MLIFDDIEELVSHMFDEVKADKSVTVVAGKDFIVEVMKEFLTYKEVSLDAVEINDFDYDKEYSITLYYDNEVDVDYWRICVEQAYSEELEEYFGIDGYVLFHEDVSSKAQIDIATNEFTGDCDYEFFVVGEDDSFESDEDYDYKENDCEDDYLDEDNEDEEIKDSDEDFNAEYTVTVKCNVDTSDVENLVRDIERSVLNMYKMFDEMNNFRRFLWW